MAFITVEALMTQVCVRERESERRDRRIGQKILSVFHKHSFNCRQIWPILLRQDICRTEEF